MLLSAATCALEQVGQRLIFLTSTFGRAQFDVMFFSSNTVFVHTSKRQLSRLHVIFTNFFFKFPIDLKNQPHCPTCFDRQRPLLADGMERSLLWFIQGIDFSNIISTESSVFTTISHYSV